MSAVHPLRRSLEGRDLTPFTPTVGEGILTRARHLSEAIRFLSRFGESHQTGASEADIATPPLDNRSKHPAFRPVRRGNQVQTVPVGDSFSASGALQSFDGASVQS
jgi:hypothetical protein